MLHFPPNKPNVMYIGAYDLGEAARGDAIIVWVCQGARCHQCKENALVGGLRFFLLFTLNWELEIPLDEWPHNTKKL